MQYGPLWAWKSSRFINFQSPNSFAFESMTGLTAPPFPISFRDYVKAGIPLYSFLPESDVPPLTDTFWKVKSVSEIDKASLRFGAKLGKSVRLVGVQITEEFV
jgi:hypothetical protein